MAVLPVHQDLIFHELGVECSSTTAVQLHGSRITGGIVLHVRVAVLGSETYEWSGRVPGNPKPMQTAVWSSRASPSREEIHVL